MKYVYILQSLSNPDKHYTGITDDVEKRLELHNSGEAQSHHTKMYGPWKLTVQIGFEDSDKAHAFERYLIRLRSRFLQTAFLSKYRLLYRPEKVAVNAD